MNREQLIKNAYRWIEDGACDAYNEPGEAMADFHIAMSAERDAEIETASALENAANRLLVEADRIIRLCVDGRSYEASLAAKRYLEKYDEQDKKQ